MATIQPAPEVLDDMHYANGERIPAEVKVQVALDGKVVLLDLTEANSERLHQAIDPWFQVGTEVKPEVHRRRPTTTNKSNDRDTREQNTRIRAWAEAQQMQVNERGRIPDKIREAYFRAHPEDQPIAD